MESLKWPHSNHSNHIGDMLRNLRNFGELADLTIVCDGDIQIKAHKAILSTFSPVIKTILSNLPQADSVIQFAGVHLREIVSILEFMYLGETVITKAECRELLAVARNLEIREIVEKVQHFFDEVDDGKISYNNDPYELKFQESNQKMVGDEDEDDPSPLPQIDSLYAQMQQKYLQEFHEEREERRRMKRGRGRPKGSKGKKWKKMIQSNSDEFHSFKRGRGRPKGSLGLKLRNFEPNKEVLEWGLQQMNDEWPEEERPKEQCPVCGKKYKNRTDLEEHVIMIHEEEGQCPECGKVLSSKASLIYHLETAHKEKDTNMEEDEEHLMCLVSNCERTFPSKNARDKHVREFHDGRNFCPECNKTFVSRQIMLQHRLSVHEGARYQCQYEGCEYKATLPNHLIVHAQSVHMKIRYPCDQCPHMSSSTSHLRRHKVTQHRGTLIPARGNITAGLPPVSYLTSETLLVRRPVGRPASALAQVVGMGAEKPVSLDLSDATGETEERNVNDEVHEDYDEFQKEYYKSKVLRVVP